MSKAITELEMLKRRLHATWTAGDFDKIAQSYAEGAAAFMLRLEPGPGLRILDVACGTGNLTLPAARQGATVTGIDIAGNLLDQARQRAQAEGLSIQFDEADAEQMPYADAAFDLVVSMFGAMFAPRPEQVTAEMLRVCRSGGRLAMANWIPTSFVGKMFKTTGAHVPPPSSMPSPLLWGDEMIVRERLREGITVLHCQPRRITFNFPCAPAEVVEFWRTYYGPTHQAFEALKENAMKQAALRQDLERLWLEHNQATDGTTRVESEYLEVLATRR